MRKHMITAAMSIATLTPLSAHAQDRQSFYAGLGVSGLTWADKEDIFDGVRTTAVTATIGTRVLQNLAVEMQVGTGVSSDSIDFEGDRVSVKNKEFYGLYLRPFITMSNNTELYGRLGYFSGKVSAVGSSISETDRKSDFSYGLGAAVGLTKSFAATLEYNQYFNKDDIKVTGVTLGIRSYF